jgi:hypothetical protein
MSDILLLEDNLYDVYAQVLGENYPIVQADESAPELDSVTSTYVVLEVENLEQLGGVYNYNVTIGSDDNTYLRTKTEYTFQLIFTAHGPDADKVTRLLSRSRNNTDHQYLLIDVQIALRQVGAIRRLPRIAGANLEKGSTITLEMGVADIVENQIDTIDITEVIGTIPTSQQSYESDIIVEYVEPATYLSQYGYEIDTVFKDYHNYINEYGFTINLGSYLDYNELDKINDGGTYPI